jgi:hypothetical protein
VNVPYKVAARVRDQYGRGLLSLVAKAAAPFVIRRMRSAGANPKHKVLQGKGGLAFWTSEDSVLADYRELRKFVERDLKLLLLDAELIDAVASIVFADRLVTDVRLKGPQQQKRLRKVVASDAPADTSLVQRRSDNVDKKLREWKRKAKTATTKVKFYSKKAKYYSKKLGG